METRKKPRKIEAVVWDFDGVIHDSETFICDTANHLLLKHGLQEVSYEEFRNRQSNDWTFYRERGMTLTDSQFREFFYGFYESSKCGLVEGVLHTLGLLCDQGICCAIVSAHRTVGVEQKLRELAITSFLSPVIGGTVHKSDAMREVCRMLEVPPENALYVGDLRSDVSEAREAGLVSVLLAPPDYPYRDEAQYHINCITELLLLVGTSH